MGAQSRRANILDAAANIVDTSGAAHLTMDAVAEAAGVSKGGVLYHFPSKQVLLEGMLERLLDHIKASTQQFCVDNPDMGHAALVARIVEQRDETPLQRAMGRAFLAAAAENPEMMAPAHAMASETFDEVAAGDTAPEAAWVILLAVEGLRFLEMLKLLPLSESQRNSVQKQLLDMVQGLDTARGLDTAKRLDT